MDIQLFQDIHNRAKETIDANPIVAESKIKLPESSELDNTDDVTRLIAFWKNNHENISDEELKEAISDELEMLEYGPDTLPFILDEILKGIGR